MALTRSASRSSTTRGLVESLLRPRGCARGAYDLPGDRRAEGLRHHRRAVSRARGAAPREGRGAPRARGTGANARAGGRPMTELVQVALAESVAEAEEIQ